MSEQDKDVERLKASVSCAVLLERLPPVWRLDRAESSRAQPEIPPRRGGNRDRQPRWPWLVGPAGRGPRATFFPFPSTLSPA